MRCAHDIAAFFLQMRDLRVAVGAFLRGQRLVAGLAKRARFEVFFASEIFVHPANFREHRVAFFGRQSPLLAQLGVKAHGNRRALTPEQKVLRAARARATRAARHTMGVRQKAAVKSDGKLSLSVNEESGSGPKAAPVVTPTP